MEENKRFSVRTEDGKYERFFSTFSEADNKAHDIGCMGYGVVLSEFNENTGKYEVIYEC